MIADERRQRRLEIGRPASVRMNPSRDAAWFRSTLAGWNAADAGDMLHRAMRRH
jgi:hypothetical protein